MIHTFKIFFRILLKPNINAVYMWKFALFLTNKRLNFCSQLVKYRLITKYGIHLGLGSKVGNNLKLPHPQSIIIGEGTIIGNNCEIYHNVTFGTKHSLLSPEAEYPIIGDNVKIFTGAIILGGIKIGDNSIIGANSLVLKDVESNSVYIGSPAKKVKEIINSVNFN